MTRYDGTASDFCEVDLSAASLPKTVRELFVLATGDDEATFADSRYEAAIAIVAVDGPGTLTLKNTRGATRGPMAYAAGEVNSITFTGIEAASGITSVKLYV
jgi:hypothetical protein